jgi:hypothetical protein
MSSEPPDIILPAIRPFGGWGGGGGESPIVQSVVILNQLPACCCGAEKKKAFLKITVACFKNNWIYVKAIGLFVFPTNLVNFVCFYDKR